MLISYYANKKSSPRLPSWQPSLIFFNIPIESGSIIKPCTLKHFQVPYRLHKAGYWTITNKPRLRIHVHETVFSVTIAWKLIMMSQVLYVWNIHNTPFISPVKTVCFCGNKVLPMLYILCCCMKYRIMLWWGRSVPFRNATCTITCQWP